MCWNLGHCEFGSRGLLALAFVIFPTAGLAWPTLELEAVADNTLYESEVDNPPVLNELSNGEGIFLFAGRTGFDAGFRLRRALLKFDLSVLPAGSGIVFAELVLYHSRAAPGSPPSEMTLHPVSQNWGEGASDAAGPEGQGAFAQPGDATWFRPIYDSGRWQLPGGDFAVSPSASTVVGELVGDFVWPCTQAMLDDLNAWANAPEQNFGWVLLGFEDGGMNAHRFHSREHPDTETRPRLRIAYRPPGTLLVDGFEPPPDCD